MSLQKLILSASEYKIHFDFSSAGKYDITTTIRIDYTEDAESEHQFAIGSFYAIGVKSNGAKITGTIEFQAGELALLLKNAGVSKTLLINEATLAITSIGATPAFSKTISNLIFTSENLALDNKAKHSPIVCKFDGIAA